MRTIRHHLLEIILWPNEDGSFKTILNSPARLRELGIYDDFKMTIKMTNVEHNHLHWAYPGERRTNLIKYNKTREITDEFRAKQHESHLGQVAWNKGGSSWCKGKKFSEEHRRKLSEAAKRRYARQRIQAI